jgi:predicted RNA-binding protein associated with RNAse of E/G family
MSSQRKAQWNHRLELLHALRERFTTAHQYDRAYKTYLAIQHAYDLWADEMFRSRG